MGIHAYFLRHHFIESLPILFSDALVEMLIILGVKLFKSLLHVTNKHVAKEKAITDEVGGSQWVATISCQTRLLHHWIGGHSGKQFIHVGAWSQSTMELVLGSVFNLFKSYLRVFNLVIGSHVEAIDFGQKVWELVEVSHEWFAQNQQGANIVQNEAIRSKRREWVVLLFVGI